MVTKIDKALVAFVVAFGAGITAGGGKTDTSSLIVAGAGALAVAVSVWYAANKAA